MESADMSRSSLLYIILFLCVLNLICTGYLLSVSVSASHLTADSGKALTPLPAGLTTPEERRDIFDQLVASYNVKDSDALYDLMDEMVRVKVPRENMVETIEQLHHMAGRIKSGAYDSYEVREGPDATRHYKLYYPVVTEKGQATVVVMVFQQGDNSYCLRGFRINSN